MSLTSKLTLLASAGFTATIVYYVHAKQITDRQSMREGVIKDFERQEMKKIQNLKALQDQIELTKALKRKRDQEDFEDHQNK